MGSPVLHRLSQAEQPDQERCIPPSPDAGDHGVYGRHPVLFHYGPEVGLLAGQDGQRLPAIHRFMVGSMGVYEFLRMPYGLCNTPVTFQRLMQNCLGELNLTYALIYLDDVIVFSQTEEEHLHCLRVVFSWFLEHGLKLKPSKCHFLQDEITFLGHEISADGMRPGTANLKAIAEMAPLKTYTEIRHFTSMTGFFWQFIKGMPR